MSFFHCYKEHRFNKKALKTVEQANLILTELSAQGYTLSLRQLHYQFVRRNWMENTQKNYKRLGRIVTDARESGVMDWFLLEDRTRHASGVSPEEDPKQLLDSIELGLLFDQWARQDHYIEVWVEKDALIGVVSPPCRRLHVTNMACKGYLSSSEAWRAGLRFQDAVYRGKTPVLIHLADHDPSGLNMTKDNRDRVRLFSEYPDVEVRRIALNMDQVEEHKPPPNFAKETDSRAKKYMREFGKDSWELDALEPAFLDKLITDTINEYRDEEVWNKVHADQQEARKPLVALGKNWAKVEGFLRGENLV